MQKNVLLYFFIFFRNLRQNSHVVKLGIQNTTRNNKIQNFYTFQLYNKAMFVKIKLSAKCTNK